MIKLQFIYRLPLQLLIEFPFGRHDLSCQTMSRYSLIVAVVFDISGKLRPPLLGARVLDVHPGRRPAMEHSHRGRPVEPLARRRFRVPALRVYENLRARAAQLQGVRAQAGKVATRVVLPRAERVGPSRRVGLGSE